MEEQQIFNNNNLNHLSHLTLELPNITEVTILEN